MLYSLLANRAFLRLLFFGNLLGAIYGYIWYLPQLQMTEPRFWLFVPDSPTAILFFTLALVAFLGKKHWPLMEALGIVCLVKYGLWAVGMNIFYMVDQGVLVWGSVVLILTHGFMAVEGILYAPFYRFRIGHFMIAAVWVFHNDVIDYVFGQMPIYMGLEKYLPEIGYATFWLTVLVLWFVYDKTIKNKHLTLEFPHDE
ncbi:DUF1405 domain-containing protein [Listeria monocytogenes]|uniref:DUF1405 domain-containing protein n=1 Tax=Listeria monocytogenes TaxID=1639 RepID=UPI00083DD9FD|nr:DUF1405 domain-containing protein [Listeria monocytogenes]EIM5111192.1 DUF1405 domain-containing protein [Listeria monocytogenes]EIN1006951.1 DUF1405 domain-containing protein [Listeria monocytogenes]EIZ3189551.1 DUF1405 domain-containing protein [Listeria monocytogenes]EIZ3441798.1 DUF1405 domain-containing protein [Listeria monocytogenes]ODE34549.1 hypothetical protein BB682_06505 [Listeria monocytogenes]